MKAGIWLDNHKAFIVFVKNGKEKIIRIDSDVEDFHVHGGAAAPAPYGPHDAVSEKRFLERKRQQLNKYFRNLIDKIKSCEAIYVFGPAEAKIGLKKELSDNESLRRKLLKVETCDSMTENQIVAKVKSFFKAE